MKTNKKFQLIQNLTTKNNNTRGAYNAALMNLKIHPSDESRSALIAAHAAWVLAQSAEKAFWVAHQKGL